MVPAGHRAIAGSVLHLRAVALRYRREMECDLEKELREAEREGWVR